MGSTDTLMGANGTDDIPWIKAYLYILPVKHTDTNIQFCYLTAPVSSCYKVEIN